jgi:hypothetical protein
MNSNISTSNQVFATEFSGGEGVLVDLNTKRYYQLNETAMLIWQALEKSQTLDQIALELTRIYDVTAEHAAKSVDRVVKDLQSLQLVSTD